MSKVMPTIVHPRWAPKCMPALVIVTLVSGCFRLTSGDSGASGADSGADGSPIVDGPVVADAPPAVDGPAVDIDGPAVDAPAPDTPAPDAPADAPAPDATAPDGPAPDAPAVDAPAALDGPPADTFSCTGPLSTDFTSGLPSWATPYSYGVASVATGGGEMVVDVSNGSVDSYAGIISPTLAFIARAAAVEVTQMVNTAGPARAYLCINTCMSCIGDCIIQESGTLNLYRAGIYTPAKTVPYDPVAHRWWRLREQAGVTYAETSADGSSYAALASFATPAASAATELWVGAWNAKNNKGGEVHYSTLSDCFVK